MFNVNYIKPNDLTSNLLEIQGIAGQVKWPREVKLKQVQGVELLFEAELHVGFHWLSKALVICQQSSHSVGWNGPQQKAAWVVLQKRDSLSWVALETEWVWESWTQESGKQVLWRWMTADSAWQSCGKLRPCAAPLAKRRETHQSQLCSRKPERTTKCHSVNNSICLLGEIIPSGDFWLGLFSRSMGGKRERWDFQFGVPRIRSLEVTTTSF